MGGEINIVDKKVGEKGICFRFNVLFKVSNKVSEDDKTPSHGNLSSGSGSNTPFSSPIRHDYNSSIVVLFIRGDERRRITKRFLRAHQIKVGREKCRTTFRNSSSVYTRTEKHVFSKVKLRLPDKAHIICKPKGCSLGEMDGTDESLTLRTSRLTIPSFILLVIDITHVDFDDIRKAVTKFRKGSKNACFRVVWLGSRLHEKQLPPYDVIIPMPLHGSCLYSLFNLLRELGGMIHCTPPHRNKNQPTPTCEDEIQETTSRSPLRGRKVLLGDDNIVQLKIAKKMIEKHGYAVETCRNGEEDLTKVSKGLSDQTSNILPYEYILMDYQMPVMDGCEATRWIRLKEKDYGVHIPIIGLTAHQEGEELNKMRVAGIDDHVGKPLKEHELMKVIEDLQSRK